MTAANELPRSKVLQALDLTRPVASMTRSADGASCRLVDKPGHLRRKRPEGHVVADESSRYAGLLLEGQHPRQGWTDIQGSQADWSFEAQRLQKSTPAESIRVTHPLNPTGQALAHQRR